jgi:uncharacterized tellurite resistance protein B-like protein
VGDQVRDKAIVTVMVLMTLADGRVVESEVTRMRWIYGKLIGRTVSGDDLRAIIAEVKAADLEIGTYVESVRDELTVDGKRRLLKAAFTIATADGSVPDEEDKMLLGIAKALGVTPQEYRAAVSHMMIARELE